MQELLRRVLKVWEKRLPLTPTQLEALGEEAYLRGWGLAGIWEKRFLEKIQDSLTGAIQKGTTYSEWTQNDGQKILDAFGAGVSTYRGGSRWDPWYSELVMRNATQASFAGGRYSAMWSPEWQQIAPFWRYYATLDDRTRPEHAALHGRVFRKDDPAARSYLPPLGHGCRCQAQELTLAEVEDAGYQITDGNLIPLLPTEGGGTIGRPPGGWDVDRVAANGSRVLGGAGRPLLGPTFRDVSEAGAAFKQLGVDSIRVMPPASKWGQPLLAAEALHHTETVFETYADLLSRFPEMPREFRDLVATDHPSGLAIRSTGSIATKARPWTNAEWTEVLRQESMTGRFACVERQPTQVQDCFRHELGHLLGTEGLATWKKIVKAQPGGLAWFQMRVSDYASVNYDEAMAECFAMATRADYRRGTLPKDVEDFVFGVMLKEP